MKHFNNFNMDAIFSGKTFGELNDIANHIKNMVRNERDNRFIALLASLKDDGNSYTIEEFMELLKNDFSHSLISGAVLSLDVQKDQRTTSNLRNLAEQYDVRLKEVEKKTFTKYYLECDQHGNIKPNFPVVCRHYTRKAYTVVSYNDIDTGLETL